MKVEDLRRQSIKELRQQLDKCRSDLAAFNLDIRTKDVSDVRLGRRLRRDIARIETLIKEKERGNG